MFCIEFVRGLVRTSDSPALELFSVVSLGIAEDGSAGHVRDANEEEALRHQRMRNFFCVVLLYCLCGWSTEPDQAMRLLYDIDRKSVV